MEGGRKEWNIEKSAKTGIKDSEQAHEEANMLASYVEGKERPTTKDYENALNQLEMLEEAANKGAVESMDEALRAFVAGGSVAIDRIPRLLAAAALNVMPYPKNAKESIKGMLGGGVIEQLKRIPQDYEERRALFQTAREELEKWKAEAEEFAKKQNKTTEPQN